MKISASVVIALLPAVASFAPESNRGTHRNNARQHSPALSSQIAAQPPRQGELDSAAAVPVASMESSPASSSSSNGGFGSNYAAAARKRSRQKSSGAPIVDSTLLRFISSQKKKEMPQHPSDVASQQNPSGSYLDSLNSTAESLLLEERIVQQKTADQLDPWMGQYNRKRVAQKLMVLGVSEQAALHAGEQVQDHVLMRTARRRVREFLRERDSLWNSAKAQNQNNGAMTVSQQLIEQKILNSEPPHPHYGVDDVIELMLEYGLTGNDICTILAHSPGVALMMPRRSLATPTGVNGKTANGKDNLNGNAANGGAPLQDNISNDEEESLGGGETLEQTLNRSFRGLLSTTLKLRRYDARKVLRGCPGLLSMRGSKSAVQVVAMMTKLGVSTSSMARDKTALPTLLSRSPAGIFRLISFLSSDAVRMPLSKIGPLIRRADGQKLLDAVTPVPRLQKHVDSDTVGEEQAIDQKVESAIYGRSSEVRRDQVNEVYKNMTKTAWILRNEIGAKDLGKVVAAYPSVLLLDADTQILPSANYLMEELGIMEGDLVSVLQLYPALLGKDVYEMQKVVEFLEALEIQNDNLPIMFRAFPALLTLDVDKDMMPVVTYLQSIGISNIGRFVARLPPVLGYSVENELEPKWQFLNRVCMYANFELTKFPAYFSYPFERVIKTRYEYLSAKGFPTDIISVDTVLRFGDHDFAIKVARDLDEGKLFAAFAKNRMNERAPKNRRRPRKAKKTQSS
jgi:hypothetical protein